MDEQSVNRSRYDGLNFSYRQHMTKHFSLNANYTLSRAMDGESNPGVRIHPQGSGTTRMTRSTYGIPGTSGRQTMNERHHISLSGIVQLPLGFQVAPIVS